METRADDMAAVVAALRDNDRFLVASHENPDGDALGSLLAMHLALRQLGKDSVMFEPGEAPLPGEYTFLPLDEVRRDIPADHEERVLVAVDCAKEERLGPDPSILERAPFVVDIDHHHDNTRFGDVNLIVADASSTGEILADVFAELGVEITQEIAEALYVALVTDTGRFQYANTSAKALRLAADLIDAGADWHKVFQTVYENVQFAKLKLLARALERAEVFSGGRLVISHLRKHDFAEVGAAEPYSEGIIDYLRAVEGAMVAALIREPPRGNGPLHRVSLRASVDEIDVSVIARKSDGGGHRQAAGFSSELALEDLKRFIVEEFEHAAARAVVLAGSCSWTSRRGRRRSTSSRRCAGAQAPGRGTRERSTRSRPGSCCCCPAPRPASSRASSGSTSATSPRSTCRGRRRRATRKARSWRSTSRRRASELEERLAGCEARSSSRFPPRPP